MSVLAAIPRLLSVGLATAIVVLCNCTVARNYAALSADDTQRAAGRVLPSYDAAFEIGAAFGDGVHLVVAQRHSIAAFTGLASSSALQGTFAGLSLGYQYLNTGQDEWECATSLGLGSGLSFAGATYVGASWGFEFGDDPSQLAFVPAVYCGAAGYVMPSIRLSWALRRGVRPRFIIAGSLGLSAMVLVALLAHSFAGGM